MKLNRNLILLITITLFSCDVAEDLFKENEPPQVSEIKSDIGFTVNPNQVAKFWVSATDPEGGQLDYKWTVNGGIVQSNTQSDTLEWRAPSVGGANYLLEIEVSNQSKTTTREEDITVLSYSAPIVNIISPQINEYIIQYNQITVKSEIIPNQQISEIQFFVNDSMINSKLVQGSSLYEFDWNVSQQAGLTEIKIKAIRITGVSGVDSINVTIEGIIPGKASG